MEDETELFSRNIKYLRHNTNMKQEELAEKLFVTPQAISKWETNKSLPDIKTLSAISKLFGVNMDDLMHKDLSAYRDDILLKHSEATNQKYESKRNILVFDTKAKSYKRFIISLILFFILFIAFIATSFFQYDLYTLIGVIVVTILNLILCIYQIKILIHRKEVGIVYMNTSIEHRKTVFKICLPVNMAFIILLISVMFIFETITDSKVLFNYIYLLISLSLLTAVEIINTISYDQALSDAERN